MLLVIGRHKQSGLTLVELMLVLLIFAILTTIAVPYFSDIIRTKELNTARNAVISSLNKAKRIASAENSFVDVNLGSSTITLSSKASGKNESHSIPGNVKFSDDKSLTFSANGILVSSDGNSINSDTHIELQHTKTSTAQQLINISPTGLIAALD